MTKERLESVKNLVLTAQQELALKRSAAIQEVGSAARQLLKALKQERKARQKGNYASKISRQLDTAMGDDFLAATSGSTAAARVQSLDDAIRSFNALSTSNSKYDTVWDVQERQLQQQQRQQLQAEEQWVQTWRKLADRARRVLEDSLASDSTAEAFDEVQAADIDTAIETELQQLYEGTAAREAAENQQVAALQQMVDEVASQRREQKSKAATEEQVGIKMILKYII
eukprot:GHUV01043565.1.p1 GENE.GHUV01043565.1~~GHUV01043565.1.p1  ORF type:complete len:228 (+),score=54.56 GHUV01043565.1:760-1443(+)